MGDQGDWICGIILATDEDKLVAYQRNGILKLYNIGILNFQLSVELYKTVEDEAKIEITVGIWIKQTDNFAMCLKNHAIYLWNFTSGEIA